MSDATKKYVMKHEHRLPQGLPGFPPMKDKAELNALLQRFTNARDFNERLVVPHFAYRGRRELLQGRSSFQTADSDERVAPRHLSDST